MYAKELVKKLGGTISKNSPAILTGMAVAGFVTTVILAVKVTPKALMLIQEELDERGRTDDPDGDRRNSLTALEMCKITWRCYVPVGAIGIATVLCIIGAHSINTRRTAALASVYSITEAAFKEYKSKVVETIGHNKELKVRDEIAADRVKKNPPGPNEIVFVTGKGDHLCYDSFSGRYFRSDIEQIRKAINDLNESFLGDVSMFLTLNEVYDAFGLAPIDKYGDLMGWTLDRGQLKITFTTTLADSGEPCIVLNYHIEPRYL